MAAMSRMLPLVAFSTLAIILLALLATPTSVLSNVGGHPHRARGHDSIAKRKHSPAKRAKPQTSTLPAAATTSATTSYAALASTEAADPQSTAESSTTKALESTKPATTSAAAATTSASGGGTVNSESGKKLLIAWPNINAPTDLEKYNGSNVAGMYTWSPRCPDNAKSIGIPCYPMLWGYKQLSDFAAIANTSAGQLIFGFNEPDQADQANMSPEEAARLWNSWIRPLADKGCKLVSPATSSAGLGKQWIMDMQKACGGDCRFDYIALHWYGTSIDEFKAYVDEWYKMFGKPIIISEYACQNFGGGAQCDLGQTWYFHDTMRAWFDQHHGVAMYAPFGFTHDMHDINYINRLMSSNGAPNNLGISYLY